MVPDFRTSKSNQAVHKTFKTLFDVSLAILFLFCPPFQAAVTQSSTSKRAPFLFFLPSHAHNPTKHHHHATTTRTPSQVKERREKKSRTKEDYLQTHSFWQLFPVTKNATYAVPRGTLSRTHATPTLTPNWRHSRGTKCTAKTHESFLFSLAHETRTSAAGKSSRNFDGCLGSGARRVLT